MADLVNTKTLESYAEYADKHNIFEKFSYLINRLLLAKPTDPIQFMIEALQKPRTCAIAIHGPPASGQTQVAENISRIFDAVHIKVGQLIRAAIDKQTSVGVQVKSFVERGQLVPDSIISSLVFSRIIEPDVVNKGYVLEGFPRTREQALTMQRKGILPDHLVIFDAPDQVIIDRAVGLRYDPVTNKTYHVKFDPPPKNPQIEARLIRKSSDNESSIQKRLSIFRANKSGITSAFKNVTNTFFYQNGIIGNEEQVYQDVFSILGRKSIARGPRSFKIIIAGLPGSGKTKVAEMLESKYGFVHVSPRNVILEEVSSESILGSKMEPYVKNPELTPTNILVEAIVKRLQKEDCKEKGWVLEGFPTSKLHLEAMIQNEIFPNRLFWLQCSFEVCKSRLSDRRYCPDTGRLVNLKNIPDDLNGVDLSSWIWRPKDTVDKVQARLNDLKGLKTELEKVYSVRTSEESSGIMEEIDASGIGEAQNGKHPTFERVCELIESSLVRHVPIKYKWDE